MPACNTHINSFYNSPSDTGGNMKSLVVALDYNSVNKEKFINTYMMFSKKTKKDYSRNLTNIRFSVLNK